MNPRIKDVIVWNGIGLCLYATMRLAAAAVHPKILMALAYAAIAAFVVGLINAVVFFLATRP